MLWMSKLWITENVKDDYVIYDRRNKTLDSVSGKDKNVSVMPWCEKEFKSLQKILWRCFI